MGLTLYNTAVRAKVPFEPLDPSNVRMYVCGPTVYDRAHLGNARAAVVFDVLYRVLRQEYGADAVTYVRNFTDVDDKINAEALRRKEAGAAGTLEELIAQRSEETIGWYHDDMDALGVLRPTHEPRATGFIAQMVTMIEGLIERGAAYAAEGHVLFRVRAYSEYGALSGRSVDDMIAGARVEVAPYKEDPMDFVLWKPSDDGLPGWESPWGRGRPGWHIECSAMAAELLGETFDIHGGGADLTFPHHENEIAQSACMGHGFAKVWMHNEMLQVEGKKMSKSLGNFFTVRDLLDQGVPGEVIRFVMLGTHYRKPMDWTEKKREEAEKFLRKAGRLLSAVSPTRPLPEVVKALSNDLDTPDARYWLSMRLDDLRTYKNFEEADTSYDGPSFADLAGQLLSSFRFLGLLQEGSPFLSAFDLGEVEAKLNSLRATSVEKKDFTEFDNAKRFLSELGIEIQVTKGGVTTAFDYPTAARSFLRSSAGSDLGTVAFAVSEVESWCVSKALEALT